MADVFDSIKRSEIMSHVRSTNTKPEVALRKALFAEGLRYRINDKRLMGKPDIVFPKYKTVVFVHGCFWHGHEGCDHYSVPKSNTEYWINKVSKNKLRDKKEQDALMADGWRVIVVWECEINTKKGLLATTKSLVETIRKRPVRPLP